ncbi:hypothetical protein LVJ94_36655 [Pendulispora rubella]|uniref:Uncharacterized protein n=1 Tax=Pendulispora rubella TaxID=2741070 RepID=A0ABZ2KV58_9BACT
MAPQRFLVLYSSVVTLAFATTVFGGIAFLARKPHFREIAVERINIVEPDGTLRMVISDKARFPGMPLRGKEYPHPTGRSETGMIFLNDEGTENGGLIFGGKNENGKLSSYGSLTFDQYESDQVLQIVHEQDGATHDAKIVLSDRPDSPTTEPLTRIKSMSDGPEKEALIRNSKGTPRLTVGKEDDRSVALRLKDGQGRDRIVLRVPAEGAPSIETLDEDGKIVNR